MKASIITLQCIANYGTQLQAFATQEKLKEVFNDVKFINYKREDSYGVGLIQHYAKGNIIRALAFIPSFFIWKKKFGRFQSEYLCLEEKKYTTDQDFYTYVAEADVYITGSDQVWNSRWNQGIKKMMYLDFIPRDKPIYAYASSFGREYIDPSEVKATRKMISRYRYISVREKSGVNILQQQYNYNRVFHVLDPTLSFDGEYWRQVSKKYPLKIKKPYILVYCLKSNQNLDRYVKKLGQLLGVPIYRLCTRIDQLLKVGRGILVPDIFEFITLIDNAELVVTDSFHATAFSMNLNTEPICVYPEEFSCRIDDFLKLVNSIQRRLKSYDDFDIVTRHVDFGKVNQVLEKERNKVDKYLTMVQEDAEKFYEEREKASHFCNSTGL